MCPCLWHASAALVCQLSRRNRYRRSLVGV